MKRTLAATVCLLMLVSFTMAQVKLTFNPDKGVKYRYSMETVQDIKQSMMGQEIALKQTITMSYDMTVLEKSKEEIKVSFLYKDVYYEMASAMMNMKYDSKNPSENASGMDGTLDKIFGAMIGKSVEAVVLPDGSVKSVTGMDLIIDAMMKSVVSDGAMGAQIGEGMKQQFNNDAMRKSFEQSMKVYPSGPLKVGDSYEVNQATDLSGMTMNIKSTYQLSSVDKETAFMTVKSVIDGMDGKLAGEQNGTVQFDLKTGITKSSVLTQKFGGSISANGMEIPLNVDSKINLSITAEK